MKFNDKRIHACWFGWIGFLLMVSAHAAPERVACPEGLKWVFEGYCKSEYDPRKGSCPQRSKLARPHNPGPIVCYAKGTCSEDAQPNAKGFCVKPGEK